jgi:hypothetical protein
MKKIIIILISVFAAISNIKAEFNDLGCGARPLSMGNAFVALADDINAMYYNPAGIVRLKQNEFASSYGRLYIGLDDDSNLGWGSVGYAQPLGIIGTIGLGYFNFALLNNYVENTIQFTYGKWVTRRMAAGINIKLLKQKIFQDDYTRIDPVFNYGSKDSVQGVGVDAGYLFNISRHISFGAAIFNINQPDMGFLNESKLPVTIKSGLAYRDDKLSTDLDFSYKAGQIKVYAGGERWFFKRSLAIRTGLAAGTNEFRNFTAGFGYNFSSLQFDYAFLFPIFGINEIYGSHRISMILRFGAWPAKMKPAEELPPKDAVILDLKEKTHKMKLKYERETQTLILKHNNEIDELKQKITGYKAIKKGKVQSSVKQKEKKSISEKTKTQKEKIKKVKNKKITDKVRNNKAKKNPEPKITKKQPVKKKRSLKTPEKKVKKIQPAKQPAVVKKKVVAPVKKNTKNSGTAVKKPVKKPGKRTHRVVKGESLKDLAIKYYGDAGKWKIIYQSNVGKIERGKPKTGSVLVIP